MSKGDECKLLLVSPLKSGSGDSSLFDNSLISLLEEDFANVKSHIDNLRYHGILDIRKYFEQHPEDLARCAAMVKIADVNKATLDLYNARDKQAFKEGLNKIFTKESYPVFKEELVSLAEGKTSFESETVNQTLSGERKYVFLRSVVAPGYEKTLSKVFVSIIDITERKKVEEALRESEECYRKLFENAGIATMINDREGNFKYINERYAELFGYTVEEMKKQSMRSIVHPEDIEKVMKYHKSRVQGKKVPSRYEFRGVKKNGSIIYLEVEAAELRKGGDIIGTRSYIWDITSRKKDEETLRESEERYRSIVEYSCEGIIIVDDAFRIIYCNDKLCRILGYSQEEIRGQDFRIYLDKDSKKLVADRCLKRQRGENISSRNEFDVVRKNGEKRHIEISSTMIKNKEGKVETIAQILDITERKQEEKELKNTLAMLRKAFGATFQAITRTVEIRDPYTAGHQRRVADLARSIAKEMGLSIEQIDGIRMSASIHDIGKISVPAEILSRPGRLSEMEFNMVKNHPKYGYEILEPIEFPWPVAQIVLQHHERIDGSGYPLGLTGKEILIEAKILAVADVVEAMTSHRPHRPALGIDKALEEISKNNGVLYDSKAVEACLIFFLNRDFQFHEHKKFEALTV